MKISFFNQCAIKTLFGFSLLVSLPVWAQAVDSGEVLEPPPQVVAPTQTGADPEPVPSASVPAQADQPATPAQVYAGEGDDANAPEISSLQRSLLDAISYNVFQDLPKIGLKNSLQMAPLQPFTFGPYQLDKRIYEGNAEALKKVEEYIKTLEEVVTKDTGVDPNILDKRIFLADLYNMRYQSTRKDADYSAALEKYTRAYKDLTSKYFGAVALNMANLMIQHGDTVTALPILKKIYKDNFAAGNILLKQAAACLLNLYFLEGRYEKAYEIFAPKLKSLELNGETLEYKLRVGDVLFFLGKDQDASEWYQTVLKPSPEASPAENLSWLYLAEAAYRQHKDEASRRIFAAMKPYFSGSLYEHVIDFRLATTKEEAQAVLDKVDDPRLANWMKLDLAQNAYRKNPLVFKADYFNEIVKSGYSSNGIQDVVDVIMADIYERDGDYFAALPIYRNLEMKNKDPFIDDLYSRLIVDLLVKQGYLANTEDEAKAYLKFLDGYEFYLQTADADKVYDLLHYNLEKMGMEGATAELTLHIIDRTLKAPADKARIYLRLAKDFHKARVFHASLRSLGQVDVKLLTFNDRQAYYQLSVDNNLELDRMLEALGVLEDWAKEGYSAKDSYWIALKKVEINNKYKKYEDALSVIDQTIGFGKLDSLPSEYDEVIVPLLAQQVILENKVGKHNECLVAFYSYLDRLMKDASHSEILLAAVSSALAMNKNRDVEKILTIAKERMDNKTYVWLEKWARGEMWINQVDRYLDQAQAMAKDGEKQGATHVQ